MRSKYRALEESIALITAETVKQSYLAINSAQKGHKIIELLNYYKKIWEPKLKRGGFKNYKTTIEYVRLFIAMQFRNGDAYLSQLNMQMATEFEHYVRTNPLKAHDPCLGNGLAKHIQRFKRVINWAVEIEWLKANPFEKYSCPQKKSKRKKLTIEELVALEEKSFADPDFGYVKDLFLYCCYTGLAFVDSMELERSHFECDTDDTVWCKIYCTKSDELCPVPLLPSTSRILSLYKVKCDCKAEGKIFPRITNQHVNKSLKIIREVCGIMTPMTFYLARHTFAKTVALKNGVPLETVQMMLGHTKITTTQIYADVDEEKIIADMRHVEERLNLRREIIRNK
jgi:site-specific recombinase XerD